MASFCTRCGRELSEGERCDCLKDSVLSKIKGLLKLDVSSSLENRSLLEHGQNIIPDSVCPDAGEQPIKQYRLTRLRSKLRGQYAEGRLQVTNKRLLFRATGISSLGKTVIQEEFAITDIAGITVNKNNRLGIMNVLGALLLSLFISAEATSVFSALFRKTEFVATLLSVILFLGTLVFATIGKKMPWLKLAVASLCIGSLVGVSSIPVSVFDIVFGFELFSFINILIFIVALLWIVLLLRVSFVPDLVFTIKTNSGGDAVQIRRRVWGAFFKQPQENSGFSEVLPWDDIELVAKELGALISDLQTMGDMAIDIWKSSKE